MIVGGWPWVAGAYLLVWASLGLYSFRLARALQGAHRAQP